MKKKNIMINIGTSKSTKKLAKLMVDHVGVGIDFEKLLSNIDLQILEEEFSKFHILDIIPALITVSKEYKEKIFSILPDFTVQYIKNIIKNIKECNASEIDEPTIRIMNILEKRIYPEFYDSLGNRVANRNITRVLEYELRSGKINKQKAINKLIKAGVPGINTQQIVSMWLSLEPIVPKSTIYIKLAEFVSSLYFDIFEYCENKKIVKNWKKWKEKYIPDNPWEVSDIFICKISYILHDIKKKIICSYNKDGIFIVKINDKKILELNNRKTLSESEAKDIYKALGINAEKLQKKRIMTNY